MKDYLEMLLSTIVVLGGGIIGIASLAMGIIVLPAAVFMGDLPWFYALIGFICMSLIVTAILKVWDKMELL